VRLIRDTLFIGVLFIGVRHTPSLRVSYHSHLLTCVISLSSPYVCHITLISTISNLVYTVYLRVRVRVRVHVRVRVRVRVHVRVHVCVRV